ncbi:MAG TPA: GAF domain-containing protein [Methanobacteriaceae archaeon]|nr:GAF domain-containing protein [Methanobacteriaceae archaeon]
MKSKVETENSTDEKIENLRLEVSNMLPDCSLKEVSDIFLDVATDLTGSRHGYVAFVDPKNGDSVGISFSHLTGACQMYEDMGEARFKPLKDGSYGGLLGYSLDTGKAIYSNDPANHPVAHGLPPHHEPVERFLSVPVIYKGIVLGQIVLGNSKEDYSPKQVSVAEKIAELYSVVLKELLYKEQ